jgi:hypothetical protein
MPTHLAQAPQGLQEAPALGCLRPRPPPAAATREVEAIQAPAAAAGQLAIQGLPHDLNHILQAGRREAGSKSSSAGF